MKFGEKLIQLRTTKNISKDEVAKAVGITKRAYQDYENGTHYPRTRDKYEALADFFGVDVSYLYTETESFIDEAGRRYASRGRKQANVLVNELAGMFAGGELSDEDMAEVMLDIQRAYWFCKEDNNRKYTPKKYRKS